MSQLPLRPNATPTSSRASSSSASPPAQQQPNRRGKAAAAKPERDSGSEENSVFFVNFSNPTVDRKARSNKVAIKKWVTKRQHANARNQAPDGQKPAATHAKAARSSASSASATTAKAATEELQIARRQTKTIELLNDMRDITVVGPSAADPFSALPIDDVGDHASRLVYVYLNACTASLKAFANREQTRELLSVVRKNAWHPLAVQSPAAYSALVAFSQVSQGWETPDAELTLRKHTTLALAAANSELASLRGTDSSDALCYAVVLLMLAAQRLNDPASFHAHARGLSALIYRRARARNARGTLTPAEQMMIDDETKRMAVGPRRWDALLSPEKLHPTVPHVPGFHRMIEAGLCSPVTSSFLAQVVATFEICLQAQGDWLVINSMFQHVFVDDGAYKRIWADSPRQVYLVLCSRLCQHYALWPMREHPCHTTEFAVASLQRQLVANGVDDVLELCPGTMLWVSVIGGAGTVGPLQSFFARLMRESCRRVPGVRSFEALRSYLYENFLWAPGGDDSAREFWDATMLGSPRQSPSLDSDGSESGSPRIRKKKRPDVAELSVPALARGPADLGFCSGAYRGSRTREETTYYPG